jgi:predicted phosphoadenosine phosphosulfate sulfurtransferase
MKIAISFSGGRTSAVMTRLIIQRYPKAEILVLFANKENIVILNLQSNRANEPFTANIAIPNGS